MWREAVRFAREIHAMLAAARLLTALLHLLARGLLGPYWKQQLATVTTSQVLCLVHVKRGSGSCGFVITVYYTVST